MMPKIRVVVREPRSEGTGAGLITQGPDATPSAVAPTNATAAANAAHVEHVAQAARLLKSAQYPAA